MNRVVLVLVLVLEFHDYSSTKDEDEDEDDERSIAQLTSKFWRCSLPMNRSALGDAGDSPVPRTPEAFQKVAGG